MIMKRSEDEPHGPMNRTLWMVNPVGKAATVIEDIEARLGTDQMNEYRYAIESVYEQDGSVWVWALGDWARQIVERVVGKRISSRIPKQPTAYNPTQWRCKAYKVQGPITPPEAEAWHRKPTVDIGDRIVIDKGPFKGEVATVRSKTTHGTYRVELVDAAVPIEVEIGHWRPL